MVVPDDAGADAVERAVRAMWQHCDPDGRRDPRFLGRVRRLCRRLGSVDRVVSLDDAAVDGLVRCPRLWRCVRRLRHFLAGRWDRAVPPRTVPAAFWDAIPGLRRGPGWPPAVAAFLYHELPRSPSNEDGAIDDVRNHLLRWMATVCEAHQQRHPRRDPRRTRAWISRHLLRIFRLAERARDASQTLADFLPFHASIDDLREAFARILIVWVQQQHQHPGRNGTGGGARPSGRRATSCVHGSHLVRVTLVVVRSAIQSGVFPAIPPARSSFTIDTIHPVMLRLAREDPARWSFCETPDLRASGAAAPPAVRPRRPALTEAEAARLVTEGCRTPWERALLVLLCTVAPRVDEICHLRVDQVWDSAAARVRDRLTFVEKGSRARTVCVRAPLRAALESWLRPPAGGHGIPPGETEHYLFEASEPRCGRPVTRGTVRNRLRRVCARAGVRPVNPHAFRAFVVNFGVRRGSSLQHMAGFLNHRSASTTAAYYWTDDVAERVAHLLDGADQPAPPAGTVGTMLAELRAVRTEIDALRATRASPDPATGVGSSEPVAPPPLHGPVPEKDGREAGSLDVDALFERLAGGGQ